MGAVLFTVTDFTASRDAAPVVHTVSQFLSPFRPEIDSWTDSPLAVADCALTVADGPLAVRGGHFATRAQICPTRGAERDTMQGDAIKELKACVN